MPLPTRLLAVAILVLTVLLPPAPPAQAQANQRVLLALYYAWFSPDSFGPGLTSDTPVEPYESDDPVVIARQIDQARRAGLDGFVVSWLGPGNRTDQNLARMLELARPRGFKVSVYVETSSMGGPDEVAANLSYLLSTYGADPSFLRRDDRPVLFFWRQQVFGPAAWSGIRQQVDPTWSTVWIAEGTTSAYFNAFDGLHLFNISWSADPTRPLQTWAARTTESEAIFGPRLFIPTIMPGYDDLAVRGGYARSREGGAYFQSTMDAALAVNPQWAVLITSWNEWPEGTQIEPSVSYGTTYLDLAAAFAARLKG